MFVIIRYMDNPRYEYSRSVINERISYLKNLALPFGYVLRYAVKANPHPEILLLLNNAGVHFDASSSYEATELLALGIPGEHISLSSQQSPHNLEELLQAGVLFVATSLYQIDCFLACPNHPELLGVRINPDIEGGGHNKRTSTGGVNASFGIWHKYIPEILEKVRQGNVRINRMHIHIGSGADARIWEDVIVKSLAVCEHFPDVTSLDIGGGYKIHRFGTEKEADLEAIAGVFSTKLNDFNTKHDRALQLEIEPGTYFIAHAGTLVARVDDIVDTGEKGYTYVRLNTGMNDFLRSTLYGARHKIKIINNSLETNEYVAVGHNCESGDIFTPVPGNPEEIEVIALKKATIGDEIRISDTGAYCASMRAKGYNSFPDAPEFMVD